LQHARPIQGEGARRRAYPAAIALALLAALPAPAADEPRFDWCAPVVISPDSRTRANGDRCEAPWSEEAIGRGGARVVQVGGFRDVALPNATAPGGSRCQGPETHRDNARYVARLRAQRAAAGGPPLRIVHATRFDLVADSQAAEPGFRAEFLVPTRRPWSEVLAFFAADRSSRCGVGGCRFTMAYGGWEDRNRGAWLSDSIDRAGGAGRHESVVYYLVRANQVKDRYWPTAALADLRDPAYRAWRVAQAKRALEVGGYDAIAYGHKFHQYREEHWIGGREVPDVAALRRKGDDTFWTAKPVGYGYPEYVQGWVALARDLRAAGVPYAMTTLSTWPWIGPNLDDPSTPAVNEMELIHEVVRGARIVLLERTAVRDQPALEAFAASVAAAGAEVVRIDTRCGFGSASSQASPSVSR
jgi:hypothetical protein